MSLPTPGEATIAQIGKGSTIWYFAGSGTPTWVQAAELVVLKMPKHKANPVEVMRYDSPSNFPELIPGWCSSDPLSFEFVYSAAQGAALTQDAVGSLRSNVTTAAGMFAYGLLNTDPVTVKMVAGDTFLPVLKVPGAIYIATVKF
jgi:hypothetical protein